MANVSALDIARDMLHRHGLRAQAIASERIAETRQTGDAVALQRWEQTYSAICELRRTAASKETDGQRDSED